VVRGIGRSALGLVISLVCMSGLAPAAPVSAASGPTIIAAHREDAIDVRGNSTFGTVASVSLPAGNWLVSANALLVGTDYVSRIECQLFAGSTSYKGRTLTSPSGVHSVTPLLLLWGAHYATAGKASLKCYSNGATGDVLIRDVHLVAVKVGTLTTNAGTSGTGAPRAYAIQDPTLRVTSGGAGNYQDLQTLSLGAGRWLVQATGWYAETDGDAQIDCRLQAAGSTADQASGFMPKFNEYSVGLEGIVALSAATTVHLQCASSASLIIYGSAINTLKIGTLRYGQLGSSQTSSGSGTPVVDAGYTEAPAYVASGDTLTKIASYSLPAGDWVTTASETLINAAPATEACQLALGAGRDLGRAKVAYANFTTEAAWFYTTLEEHLTSGKSAQVSCDESAGANTVLWWHLRIIGLEAGSLTDTALP
jgi:hypothetical protein